MINLVILEVMRLNSYTEANFKLSYSRTKENAEIDLIIEQPVALDVLVEIKSYSHV